MRDFIFIHEPRTGGSSITRALRPFGKEFSFADHILMDERIAKLGLDFYRSIFSFSIVRNPWDRQVSFYTYIRRDNAHHLHEHFCRYISFEEYVKQMFVGDPFLPRPQVDFLCTKENGLIVNFVGRYECIEKDFQEICNRIGVTTILPETLYKPHRNRRPNHYRE